MHFSSITLQIIIIIIIIIIITILWNQGIQIDREVLANRPDIKETRKIKSDN
jgi:hypothetical protein